MSYRDSLTWARRAAAAAILAAGVTAAPAAADPDGLDLPNRVVGLAQPKGLSKDVTPIDRVPKVALPALDMQAVNAEDEQRRLAGEPVRYAMPNEVRITPDGDGRWEQVAHDQWMWRLRVTAEDALSINLGFTRYNMPEGGMMFVYATDGSYKIRPFTAMDNEAHGELWTPVILSDDITIEVLVYEKNFNELELELGAINQGYVGFGDLIERSGACNNDVVCPEGDDWQDEISTVAAYSTGGSIFCTGYMVNNTAQDLTPYFMTADHCGISAGSAPSLVVYWNFETSTCGGTPDGQLNDFQTGAVWRAGYATSDFTLVELDDDPDPDWEVGFAGWDRRDMNFNDGAVAIHHPSGDEKRISFEADPVVADSYLGENPPGNSTHLWVSSWDDGTTEPGSSGSPLFSWDHKVIGQLHGGYASCSDLRGDWYGRFYISWDGGGSSSSRLSDWLDPLGTGQTTLDTIPGAGIQIAPGGNPTHIGVVGGPFTNDPWAYDLANNQPAAINYEVRLDAGTAPILLNGGTSAVTGTLSASGGMASVSATLDASATSLPAGVYTRDVIVEDTTNGRARVFTHTLEIGQTGFDVTPANGLIAGGPVGGPFAATEVYTITSTRPTAATVEISASDPWISLNGGAGPVIINLSGTGDSAMFTAGFSAAANSLPAGIVNGQIDITNLTDGNDSTFRPVMLDVGRFTYAATDTPLPITDNTTFTSTVNVSDAYCIGDVNVELDVSHTYIGDLRIILTSPEGTSVTLHDRTGGSADDIVVTYDDPGTPADGPGALTDYVGEFVTGTWTLEVSDNAGADTGTLNGWTLKIASSGAACPPVAADVNLNIPDTVTSAITLDGASTLGPAIDYIIMSLPANGSLSDPNGGAINSAPYTLASMGDVVNYTPDPGFVGTDAFSYKVFDGADSNIADVNLEIGVPVVIHDFPLDSNPGWDVDGDWAFGQPTGATEDPSSGATGVNVYGYNLNGDYPDNLSPVQYLTTEPLDCSDVANTTLEFQRWLAVESSTYDDANVQVSNDGVNWTTIWEHSGPTFIETAWSLQSYDISAIADGESTVFVRWGMGTTDGSVTYGGWNIDDIKIIGVLPPAPSCPGDATGDNLVNFDDLNEVLGNWATGGPAGDVFPVGAPDGQVNFDDLNTVLSNWNTSCP